MTYARAFMVGALDPYEFSLAENLHMTVAELRETMPNSEYLQWGAYHEWRLAQIEKQEKERPRG